MVIYVSILVNVVGVPRCIRADGGTENVCVQDMQKAFRWHHEDLMSGENSIIIGSSMTNQVLVHKYSAAMFYYMKHG